MMTSTAAAAVVERPQRRKQPLLMRTTTTRICHCRLSAATPSTEHLRRRQQFVFAAAVLLSSSLATGMILKEPPLLHLLWRYVERDAPLDNVQLLYWCRVVGLLILNKPPPHPEMASPVGGGEGIRVAVRSLGLPHLLRTLLVHLRSDAICALLR